MATSGDSASHSAPKRRTVEGRITHLLSSCNRTLVPRVILASRLSAMFPNLVAFLHTLSTRPIPCRDRCGLVSEENAGLRIVGQMPDRGRAVEPPVDLLLLVAPKQPRCLAQICRTVRRGQFVVLGHFVIHRKVVESIAGPELT